MQTIYQIRGKYPKHIKKLNNKKKISLKIGKRNCIDIFPKKIHKWPTGTWTMLNITNNKGNANQNYSKIYLTLVRMIIIKKKRDNKCWQGYGEMVTLVYCWWEHKLVQTLWKIMWRLLKKWKIKLPHDPAIPLLGTYPKKRKQESWRDVCTPVFIEHYSQYPKIWT